MTRYYYKSIFNRIKFFRKDIDHSYWTLLYGQTDDKYLLIYGKNRNRVIIDIDDYSTLTESEEFQLICSNEVRVIPEIIKLQKWFSPIKDQIIKTRDGYIDL